MFHRLFNKMIALPKHISVIAGITRRNRIAICELAILATTGTVFTRHLPLMPFQKDNLWLVKLSKPEITTGIDR